MPLNERLSENRQHSNRSTVARRSPTKSETYQAQGQLVRIAYALHNLKTGNRMMSRLSIRDHRQYF